MLPQGLFSVAVATVLFPTLSRMAARRDSGGMRRALGIGIRQINLLLIPSALIIAYGLLRVAASGFGEMRDAVFASVQMQAARRVALETFQHMHRLSLRFHMDRQTGGLSRAIERGTLGIQQMLRMTIFNVIPTIIEMLMVTTILGVISQVTTTDSAGRSIRRVPEIRLLRGRPRLVQGAVIAHELGHAWVFQKGLQGLPKDVEEGFCEYCSHHWLGKSCDPREPYLMDRLVRNPDPTYGGGFQKILDMAKVCGLPAVLDQLSVISQRSNSI